MSLKLPTTREVSARTNSNREKYQSSLTKEENDIRLKQNASFVGSSNDPFSTPTRDNYQTYPYDYYAGTDCKIFFGDLWVDDIITLNYSVGQTKTPIYGYASQNFDAVAKGQIIVEGQFTIAFKETGYLNIIQATLEEQRANASNAIRGKIKKLQENDQQKFIPGLTSINDNSTEKIDFSYSANGTPQIIRQAQTIEQVLTSKKATTVLNSHFGGTSANDFEDFAEILEDSIWGDSNGKTIELENKLKRADEFDYTGNGGILTAKGHNYADVLNIMLTFGDINDTRAEHTMVVLNDVHITSTSMVVTPNGDPIGESYTFIARDINKSINTKSNTFNINPIKLNVGINSKLSTLSDIKEIEDILNNSRNLMGIIIKAGLTDGWAPVNINLGDEFVSFNKIEPFVDQVIKKVEDRFNSPLLSDVFLYYNQYIISVSFADTPDITMILEQTIPNTRTYKVISPTRTGFAVNNIISRDDVWDTVLSNPTAMDLSAAEQSKNKTYQDDISETVIASIASTETPEAAEKRKNEQIKETNKTLVEPKPFVGPPAPTKEQLAKETKAQASPIKVPVATVPTNTYQEMMNEFNQSFNTFKPTTTNKTQGAVNEVAGGIVRSIVGKVQTGGELAVKEATNEGFRNATEIAQKTSKEIFDNLRGDPTAPIVIKR